MHFKHCAKTGDEHVLRKPCWGLKFKIILFTPPLPIQLLSSLCKRQLSCNVGVGNMNEPGIKARKSNHVTHSKFACFFKYFGFGDKEQQFRVHVKTRLKTNVKCYAHSSSADQLPPFHKNRHNEIKLN